MATMIWPTTPVDATLTQEGEAADAKVTGASIDALNSKVTGAASNNASVKYVRIGNVVAVWIDSITVTIPAWGAITVAELPYASALPTSALYPIALAQNKNNNKMTNALAAYMDGTSLYIRSWGDVAYDNVTVGGVLVYPWGK